MQLQFFCILMWFGLRSRTAGLFPIYRVQRLFSFLRYLLHTAGWTIFSVLSGRL